MRERKTDRERGREGETMTVGIGVGCWSSACASLASLFVLDVGENHPTYG